MSAAGFWAREADAPPLVVAHRAGAALGRENTMDALSAALAIGVAAIETDARLSADGVVVAFHDADLSRLTGDPRAVADLTLAELRALWPELMTLAELLAATPIEVGVMLDVKARAPADIARVLDSAAAAAEAGRVLIGARDAEAVRLARGRWPEAPVLSLQGNLADVDACVAEGASWVRLWERDATPGRLAGLRERGLRRWIMLGEPTATGSGQANRDSVAAALALRPEAICLDGPQLSRS